MKRTSKFLLAALTLSVTAAFPSAAQTLRIGFADPISSNDPQLNNHAGDRSLALQIFDSIVDRRDGKTLASVAKSWRTVDETTWEFTLRDDVLWHDGTPFTADDVVFSLERAKSVPGTVASYAGRVRSIESFQTPDPHTLIIKTRGPAPNLLLDIGAVHLVSRHIGATATTEDYNTGKAVIGTGPYKFVSSVPGDRWLLERWDQFYGQKADWQQVEYRFINNGAARTAALLAGDVDVIDKVSPTDLTKLRQSSDVAIHAHPGLRVLLIQPSFREGPNEFITDHAGKPLAENPLRDVRVRQALSVAINRQAIADRILQGVVTVANQDMPEGTLGYNKDLPTIPYDPSLARKLLTEAGFPEGFALTVHFANDRPPMAPETLQAVAQFWSRVGIKVNLAAEPTPIYTARVRRNEYAVSVLAWGNGTGELGYGLVNVFATYNPEKGIGASNWGRYSSPVVDEALQQYTEEFDAERQAEILNRAAKAMYDDVGIIPLFHYQNIWASRKGLTVTPYISDRTAAQMVTRDEP